MLDSRPYQSACVDAVLRELRGRRSTLVLMATGTGKTVVMAKLCFFWPRDRGRVLILVHRDELLWQALRRVQSVCLDDLVEIEQGEYYAARDCSPALFGSPRIVVASKDSLCQPRRLHSFDPDAFGLILVDECHRDVASARSYRRIRNYFGNAKIVGFTATADRADGIGLKCSYESVAYRYDVGDAIADGYLVNIAQYYLRVDGYDLSKLRVLRRSDFGEADLDHVLRREGERAMQGLLWPLTQLSNKVNQWGTARPTLIFAPSVFCALRMAEILNRYDAKYGTGKAAAIATDDASYERRREILADYRSGRIRYVTNYQVLGEGFDSPETRIVCVARATKCRMNYVQMVGRALRPEESIAEYLNAAESPEERRGIIWRSRKPSALVVDPVGNSGEHKLARSTLDILGGLDCEESQEAAEIAKDRIYAARAPTDAALAYAEAKKKAEELAAERRKDVLVTSSWTLRKVDPFDLLDVCVPREAPWFRGRPPTRPQLAVLLNAGFRESDLHGISLRKAQVLIEEVFRRRDEGLCTVAQARVLREYGLVTDMGFNEARAALDDLARRGWPGRRRRRA